MPATEAGHVPAQIYKNDTELALFPTHVKTEWRTNLPIRTKALLSVFSAKRDTPN